MMNKSGKRVNLEGILYNEDGIFKPLTDNHGNIDGRVAMLRDTYMQLERDNFETSLVDSKYRNAFIKALQNDSSDDLFEQAMEIMDQLESGELESEEEKRLMKYMSMEAADEFHMEKLEEAEKAACLFLAATKDKVKKDLIKRFTNPKEENRGRSR